MGQKQSYSLNDYKNKNATQSEVAQTFNTAEPTPVSIKSVASVKRCNDNKNDEVFVCNEVDLTPTQSLQPSPVPEISTMIPIDELHVDPELPHSILVLDKENINASVGYDVKVGKEEVHFIQPEGLLLRQPELDDNNEELASELSAAEETLPTELNETLGQEILIPIQKLEYCPDELIEQEISLLVDMQPEPIEDPSFSMVGTVLAEQALDPLIEHELCRCREIDEL